MSDTQRDVLLESLGRLGVTWEGADGRLFSLDMPSQSQYQPTCDQLWEWEQQGLLEYETCEARLAGSFDDAPRNE